MLTLVCIAGPALAGIEAGWYGLGDPAIDWVEAPDPDEISGPIQFRCVLNGLCGGTYSSAMFTIEVIVDGIVVECWDAEGSPAGGDTVGTGPADYRTHCWPDATWRVSCAATYEIPPEDPIGEPTFGTEEHGPTEFGTKNLSVTGISASGSRVTLEPPFISVGPHDDTTFTITSAVDDGYECPEELDDHFTLRLAGLGSTGISYTRNRPSDAAVPNPVDSWTAGFDADTWPGLYYVNSLVGEGNGDEDEWLSKYLRVTALAVTGFESTGLRSGRLSALLTTTDSAAHPIGSYRAVRVTPDGSVGEPGAFLPASTNCTGDVLFYDMQWPYAGTYALGLSLMDEYGVSLHSGAPRWCQPGACGLTIPAAAVFVGARSGIVDDYSADTPTTAATIYDAYLGNVRISPGSDVSFYAAVPPVGQRGGVVQGGSNATFVDALAEDEVVVYCGHGNPGFIGLQADDSLWAEEITQALADRGDSVASKLVWLSSCNSAWQAVDYPIGDPCGAIKLAGADCVVGWSDFVWEPAHRELTYEAWRLMTEEGYGAAAAVDEALEHARNEHTPDWIDRFNIDAIYCDGDTHLAPAFIPGGDMP